ncbi:hypothetical protein DBV15_01406 [Temnothorax longispinosus]|uniref:Uncharacterized protein n=1 Tax=Temnothorax longispinosus TaxID=300112 RepID=A0A4S2KZI8_9HYME|nr:hypothetical protein DBV15_01406 [Temnothorax longispinosus]
MLCKCQCGETVLAITCEKLIMLADKFYGPSRGGETQVRVPKVAIIHGRSTSSRGQCQSLVKRETRNWAKVSRRAHRGGQREERKRGREKEGNTRRNPGGDFIRRTTVSYASFPLSVSGNGSGTVTTVCRAECVLGVHARDLGFPVRELHQKNGSEPPVATPSFRFSKFEQGMYETTT